MGGCFYESYDPPIGQLRNLSRQELEYLNETSEPGVQFSKLQEPSSCGSNRGANVPNWSMQDGNEVHYNVQFLAESRWFDSEGRCRVDIEWGVQKTDKNGDLVIGDNGKPTVGWIDLLIDEKHVVDIKTDQMADWTLDDAKTRAYEHATQVRQYVDSPQIQAGATGHLYMVGARSANPKVEQAFVEECRAFNVTVHFVEDASPNGIVADMERKFIDC